MLNILTLSWEGKDKLERLYQSLAPILATAECRWLIRDNGSHDGSVSLINSWGHPKITCIAHPHNKDTFSEGVNFLYDMAECKTDDYILLLNNDIIFQDIYSISNMLGLFDKDPDIGIVGARLLYPDKTLQHAGVVFDQRWGLPTHFRAKQPNDNYSGQNRSFQAVTGACLAIRSDIFVKAGKLNTNLKWAFDDIDLCLSVKYGLNKKIVYCGKTNIFHEESASLKKNPINRLYMSHNVKFLRNRWGEQIIKDQTQYIKDPKYNLYV